MSYICFFVKSFLCFFREKYSYIELTGGYGTRYSASTLWQPLKTPMKKKKSEPYDVVMMLRILVLQRLYNLSDDQTE